MVPQLKAWWKIIIPSNIGLSVWQVQIQKTTMLEQPWQGICFRENIQIIHRTVTIQKVHKLQCLWYLWQFFLIVLAFIDDFYGYDIIVWPHSGRKCGAKLHSFLLVSFCLPWWVTWLVVILLNSDWSIKVTWPICHCSF